MKRSKLYFNTSGYLSSTVGIVLVLIISMFIGYVCARSNKMLVIWVFAILDIAWVVEWIQKHKYFGDIIFKRLETNRYKVISNW